MKPRILILEKVIIAIFSITIHAIFLVSQLMRNYLLTISSLLILSIFSSYIIFNKNSILLLVLSFIFIPLIIRVIMLLSLSNEWLLANLDLIYMMKISEKIVSISHYPYGDTEILTVRPNYHEYPIAFILQAIFSQILDLNVDVLMLFPIISWVACASILCLLLGLIVKSTGIQNDASRNHYPRYVVGLFVFNFLTWSFFLYFVYSNIIRALIVVYVYILAKYILTLSGKNDVRYIILLTFTLYLNNFRAFTGIHNVTLVSFSPHMYFSNQ